MTGMSIGVSFSLLIVMLISTVLFVYTWLSSHGFTYRGSSHLDSMAGDEGED
jgi:hypothetical protein